jgi:hypothetical protein
MIDSDATDLPEPLSPDDAEDLAALEREADAVDGLGDAAAAEEVGLEAVDLEQRHAHDLPFSRGSSASRRPSPSTLKAKTTSMSANPG